MIYLYNQIFFDPVPIVYGLICGLARSERKGEKARISSF